ncbi:polysaccharide deacetylase family protein [Gryllotalpicola koreensis]|uniref:NodB homology domain-containing protein n=1 Tax=Gryllotalpicola koreensis TaxID=993086 RepID=A0ABP8A2Z9_9MICO
MDDAGDDGDPVTVKFGGFATYPEGVPAFPEGVVSFTFDDTWAEHASYATPLLAQHGYTGTLFPILSRLTSGNPEYYDTDDLKKMVNAYGMELGAHATSDDTHISVVGWTTEDYETELRALRSWAYDNGFPPMMSYAYPVGPFDEPAYTSVRRFFGYGRTNDTRLMSPTSDYRYAASALVCSSTLTLAQAEAAVDAAKADGLWVNFIIHDLPTTTPATQNGWLRSNFASLVNYCVSSGIAVRAAGDVINAL